jgi:hypothetical protein
MQDGRMDYPAFADRSAWSDIVLHVLDMGLHAFP